MHGLKVTPLLALVFLVVGCGLPSPYFLSPPSVTLFAPQLAPSVGIIQNSGRANDYQANFEGFELYYKVYGSTSDPSFSADLQYGSINYSPPDLVNSHGFHRVTLGPGTTNLSPDSTPSNGSVPLININSIDPGDILKTFSIEVHITDSLASSLLINAPYPHSYYTYTPATGPYAATPIFQEIRRFVSVDNSLIGSPPGGLGQTCKPFARNSAASVYSLDYLPSDSDIGSQVYASGQSNSNQFVVMMYVAAFGHGGGQAVYSTPVYLGYTQVPFN